MTFFSVLSILSASTTVLLGKCLAIELETVAGIWLTGIADSVSSHLPSAVKLADNFVVPKTNSASYSLAFSRPHLTFRAPGNFCSNADIVLTGGFQAF